MATTITPLGNLYPISLSDGVTGILPVSNGGSGANTLTNHGILLGQGTSTISALSLGAGTIPLGVSSADPIAATLVGDSNIDISISGSNINFSYTGPLGTVTSVTGTANRIAVDNTDPANPIVDIASTYIGQSSLTTVGTLTAGTWESDIIDSTYGGTGINNGGKTIDLSSPVAGYVLTSDASGNGTWKNIQADGAVTELAADSGSTTPTTGTITISGGTTGLTTSGSSSTLSLTGILELANGGTGVDNSTGGTITTSGGSTGDVLTQDGSGKFVPVALPASGVTNIATGTGLTGGPITSIGTISIDNGTSNSLAGYDNSGVFSGVTVGTGLSLTSGTLTATGGSSGFSEVKIRPFTTSGTYTPTAGMAYCVIEAWGAGGGGGGCATTTSTQVVVSGAGGGGQYIRSTFAAATIGASQTVTIGAGGTAGSAGANAGGNGGSTSVGSLVVAQGGFGGAGGSATTGVTLTGGGGGNSGTGDFVFAGLPGETGLAQYSSASNYKSLPGAGGSSFGNVPPSSATGALIMFNAPESFTGYSAPNNSGAGGSGSGGTISTTQFVGTTGGSGLIIITEYIV